MSEKKSKERFSFRLHESDRDSFCLISRELHGNKGRPESLCIALDLLRRLLEIDREKQLLVSNSDQSETYYVASPIKSLAMSSNDQTGGFTKNLLIAKQPRHANLIAVIKAHMKDKHDHVPSPSDVLRTAVIYFNSLALTLKHGGKVFGCDDQGRCDEEVNALPQPVELADEAPIEESQDETVFNTEVVEPAAFAIAVEHSPAHRPEVLTAAPANAIMNKQYDLRLSLKALPAKKTGFQERIGLRRNSAR